MIIKTSELTGPALDWAVAKCMQEPVVIGVIYQYGKPTDGYCLTWTGHSDGFGDEQYTPSTDWAQGGPIIDRERIRMDPRESTWHAQIWSDEDTEAKYAPTALIAAMRCFVASKLGDEVDVPEELK